MEKRQPGWLQLLLFKFITCAAAKVGRVNLQCTRMQFEIISSTVMRITFDILEKRPECVALASCQTSLQQPLKESLKEKLLSTLFKLKQDIFLVSAFLGG